jgi:uncharacterized membrane protein
MGNIDRLFRHLVYDYWHARRAFPPHTMAAIEREIAANERRHDGEVRFAIEASLPFRDLWVDESARDRAIELFARLHVWDTEHNTGVLIYLLLADRRVEIVADRGIHQRVGAQAWESICGSMQREFREGRFEEGALLGVRAVSDLIAAHFPPRADNPNELSNKPLIIRS